ncbi:MAG: PqqD family protein [Acutalibacteraceae bacterium]|nr:PqqD family protein [Acutalibacteraceae bacterium]
MRKKNTIAANYLDKIPVKNPTIGWTADEEGIVTLEIENKGLVNRIFQKILKKPKITYIHLDENGSFVWPLIDGEKTITELGLTVKEHFGDKAEPLYERLAKFIQILDSYGFITFKK